MSIINKYRVYVDCETTGFDPIRNDVVSMAIVVTDQKMSIKDRFYQTARPEFNKFYSEEAELVHGFKRDELKKFQSPEILCNSILSFLSKFKSKNNSPSLFISHSLRQFDFLFIDWLFRKQNKQYDLWKIIRQDHQRSTITEARNAGYKNNGLDLWAKRIGFNLTHHDAMSDTLCCLEIDKYLTKEHFA